LLLSATLGIALYCLNLFGLRFSVLAGALAGLVCCVPLVLLLMRVLVPGTFKLGWVLTLSLPDGVHSPGHLLALLAKWAFVAAWASYGAEMASTLVAEVHDSNRMMPRVMAMSASITLFAFTVIPIVLIGLLGAAGVSGTPETAFLPPAERTFGDAGRTVVGLMLAAALTLSADAFIVGSSRTIYQLARDGHLPRFFSRVTEHGVPIGSLVCDAVVIAAMLLVFGSNVIDMVAAANISYLIVFILMPIAYLRLRAHPAESSSAFRLAGWARPVAAFLAAFNLVLLLVGGWQWGSRVMMVGVALTLLIIPVSGYTRSRAMRY
jgi:amino acid transporter